METIEPEIIKERKKRTIKPYKHSKVAKFIINKEKGMSKRQAALKAGYSPNTANKCINKIENSVIYEDTAKALGFKDIYLEKTSKEELVDEVLKVARQDREQSAKLTAINMAMKTIEPESSMEDNEKVVIVLKEQ